ncbi:MAG: hypothetical protein ABI867_06455 [Kofleriaceae bacterium]
MTNRTSWLLALGLAGGCGDSEDLPPLTDATSLLCPAPGDLPFRLDSNGFVRDNNAALADMRPRDKGEAADTLGNPGGATASTYLGEGTPAGGAIAYRGLKARTAVTNGLFSTPLPGEHVSLWSYDGAWTMLDRGDTDDNGLYELTPGVTVENGQPIYALLEADGSCAEHFDYLFPAGTKVVISDIDGTLTSADSELFEQTADPTYVPKTKTAAEELTRAWADKGYPIIYLTARPHVYRGDTRGWLRDLDFAAGPLITSNDGDEASAYKTLWLDRMITTFGWVPVAAYGNASTDISAYANVAIPKDLTFIIGELAGTEGTVAIPNDDFTDHIATFVAAQPASP